MPGRIPPAPPAAVSPATPRRRWTDHVNPGGGGALAAVAEQAEPGGVCVEVRPGLVIELAGRGVRWSAQLDPSGFPVLVAVDARGVRVGWTIVTPDVDVAAEIDRLWALLDTVDPVGLRLHR